LVEEETADASAGIDEFRKIGLLVMARGIVTLPEICDELWRLKVSKVRMSLRSFPMVGSSVGILCDNSQSLKQYWVTLKWHTFTLPRVGRQQKGFGCIVRARFYKFRGIMGALRKVCDRVEGVRGGVGALDRVGKCRGGYKVSIGSRQNKIQQTVRTSTLQEVFVPSPICDVFFSR